MKQDKLILLQSLFIEHVRLNEDQFMCTYFRILTDGYIECE